MTVEKPPAKKAGREKKKTFWRGTKGGEPGKREARGKGDKEKIRARIGGCLLSGRYNSTLRGDGFGWGGGWEKDGSRKKLSLGG